VHADQERQLTKTDGLGLELRDQKQGAGGE